MRARRTRLLAHELPVAAHGKARQLLAAPLGGSYRMSESSFLSSLRLAVVVALAVLAVCRRCKSATASSARASTTHRARRTGVGRLVGRSTGFGSLVAEMPRRCRHAAVQRRRANQAASCQLQSAPHEDGSASLRINVPA